MTSTSAARKVLLDKIESTHSPVFKRMADYINHEAEFDMNGVPCNEAAEIIVLVNDALGEKPLNTQKGLP